MVSEEALRCTTMAYITVDAVFVASDQAIIT